jgi:hypothetical protein
VTKEIKTTLVKESEIEIWDEESGSFVYNQPSKFMIQLATGDLLFIHTRDRLAAQHFIDLEYGKGFYLVKQIKQGTGSGEYTAGGTTSRKCCGAWLKRS